MALTQLDLPALRRWLVTARADVAAYEDDLNRLNVFPVADSDTGTNMLVTIDGALAQVTGAPDADLAQAAKRLSHAMLVNGRGNSGVILSQLAKGVYEVVGTAFAIGGPEVADMLARASRYAWQGVADPKEGTVLTVARAAAEGSAAAAARGGDLQSVVDAAVLAASEALSHTTEQLPVLRDAGVVDAGGAGLLLVLEAMQRVVQGGPGLARSRRADPPWLARWFNSADTPALAAEAAPGYEVMYLLDRTSGKRIEELREQLVRLGDSVVVAGGPKTWSVHVHTEDVSGVLNAGAASGRPHAFHVTRFADQQASSCSARVTVLATVDGAGMTQLVRDAGARPLPIRTDGGARRALVRSLREPGSQDVVLLGTVPEMRDTVREVAAALASEGIRVLLPESPTSAHVLAALAVLDPEASAEDIVSVVEDTLGAMQAATIAFGAHTSGRFGADELVAVVDGVEVARGLDLTVVGAAALRRLLEIRETPELVTIVRGAGVPEVLVHQVVREARSVQTQVVDGGSGDVALTIGVE